MFSYYRLCSLTIECIILVCQVGKGLVEIFCAHDVVGRLMIQCARASGLSHVLQSLIGFDGDEFYLQVVKCRW